MDADDECNRFIALCKRIKANDPTIRTLRPSQNEDIQKYVRQSLHHNHRTEVKALMNALAHNNVLEEIEINLTIFQIISPDDVWKLNRFLRNNKNLQALRIYTDSINDHRSILNDIFQGCACSRLYHLHLEIKAPEQVLPIAEFITQSSTLKKLSIHSSSLSTNDISTLTSVLKTNQSLQHLSLVDLNVIHHQQNHSSKTIVLKDFFDAISNNPMISTINCIKFRGNNLGSATSLEGSIQEWTKISGLFKQEETFKQNLDNMNRGNHRDTVCNNKEQLHMANVLHCHIDSFTNYHTIHQVFHGFNYSKLSELYLTVEAEEEFQHQNEKEASKERLVPIVKFIGRAFCNNSLTKLVIENSHLETWDINVLTQLLDTFWYRYLNHLEFNNVKFCCRRRRMMDQHSAAINNFMNTISNNSMISSLYLIQLRLHNFDGYTMYPLEEIESWGKRLKATPDRIIRIVIPQYMFNVLQPPQQRTILKIEPKYYSFDTITEFLMLRTPIPFKYLCLENVALTSLSPAGILMVLVEYLKNDNTNLECVTLKHNQLDSLTGSMIANALVHNKTVRRLRIFENNVLGNEESVTVWKQMLSSNKALQELEFSFHNKTICFVGLTKLFEGLISNTSLQCLNVCGLTHNIMSQYAGRGRIQRSVRSESSRRTLCKTMASVLNSSHNEDKSSRCNLVRLTICNLPDFQDIDWVEVGKSMRQNNCLQKLDLCHVGVGNQTINEFATSLMSNTTLQSLKISQKRTRLGTATETNLTVDGFIPLVENLRYMRGLQELDIDLGNPNSTLQVTRLIVLGLEQNFMLRKISYMDNSLTSEENWYLKLNRNGRRFLYNYDMPIKRKHCYENNHNVLSSIPRLPPIYEKNESNCRSTGNGCSQRPTTIPISSWPLILARMTKRRIDAPFLYYFLHELVDLLATVAPAEKLKLKTKTNFVSELDPSSSSNKRPRIF